MSSWEPVSDAALNAGFKSDLEYQEHQKPCKKRDKEFLESILYASNPKQFEENEQPKVWLVLKRQKKDIFHKVVPTIN